MCLAIFQASGWKPHSNDGSCSIQMKTRPESDQLDPTAGEQEAKGHVHGWTEVGEEVKNLREAVGVSSARAAERQRGSAAAWCQTCTVRLEGPPTRPQPLQTDLPPTPARRRALVSVTTSASWARLNEQFDATTAGWGLGVGEGGGGYSRR